jgi:hypothetical protein
MSGGNQSIKVVLRNPLNYNDQIDYVIQPADNELARDWTHALKGLLQSNNLLEKNFCFMGFPKTSRSLEYLCTELQMHVVTINNYFPDYQIDLDIQPDNLLAPDTATEGFNVGTLGPNHELLNKLHNHFEQLQGTVWNLSDYYRRADYETKYAIRQLNNICHEIENLILSQRKLTTVPYWVRPSQITTFINSPRFDLTDNHRQLFLQNGYDRVIGGVYMHWTQIGKTLFEVFRDEGAPELTDTVCEAITELKYYSGEFDVEWGNDVKLGGPVPWHNTEQQRFHDWLIDNGRDPMDPKLSLGYLPIGQVMLKESFGTEDYQTIWNILGSHLDIYKIEVNGVSNTFNYSWADSGYKQMQIDMMKPGYDYSSTINITEG